MEQILKPLVEYINHVLVFFYDKTGNYGLAIILLSLAVNVVTFPLTRKQISASRKLQEIQPELKKLQEKYKGDKEKYNRATMEYMREHKVNPLGGCLPLLIQLPIIVAVFQLLREPGAAAIENTFFLGLDLQLSATEAGKFFAFINPYYILPLVSAAATFMHQRMVLTDPKQKMMLYIFPLMILVISVSFPAGLVLYWTTNSFFSVGSHFLIKAMEKEKGGKGKDTGGESTEKKEKESPGADLKKNGRNGAVVSVKGKKRTEPGQWGEGKKQSADSGKAALAKVAPKSKKKVKGKKKGAGKNK